MIILASQSPRRQELMKLEQTAPAAADIRKES